MACTLEQFIRCTVESGLLPADDLKAFMLAIPRERRPATAEQLAKAPVLANKLTKYQAAAIFQGKHKGLMLGQYSVLDEIGAGAMGQVFKAQHRRMKRIVAIKVLPATAMRSQDAVQRFQREMQAAAKLLHQNIVAAYDADEAGGTPFLVLEYVEGSDLKSVYQRELLSVSKALDYVIQAARGLEFAHKQGVAHCDIKPANLLVDQKGVVKILDMGLARIHQELSMSDGLTRSGEIMGTVDYMSPEQAVNTHEADHRADMYSLGCTLYRLLTGKPVYEGESMMSKIVAHRRAAIPSLCVLRPDVPPDLDAVYQKMIAKEPEDRYPSMTEALAALESCRGAGKSSVQVNKQTLGDPELKDFLSSLSDGEPSSVSRSKQPAPVGTTINDRDSVSPIQVDTEASSPGSKSNTSTKPKRQNDLAGLSRMQWIIAGVIGGAVVLLLAGVLIWALWG